MATITEPPKSEPFARPEPRAGWTAADLLETFGPIPLWRVRYGPHPGAATVQDALEVNQREKRLCELVEGILVEKAVGIQESHLAVLIAHLILVFLNDNDLGTV